VNESYVSKVITKLPTRLQFISKKLRTSIWAVAVLVKSIINYVVFTFLNTVSTTVRAALDLKE